MSQDTRHVKMSLARRAPNGREDEPLEPNRFRQRAEKIGLEFLKMGNSQRLDWLLKFVARPDLDQLSDDQFYELRAEVAGFCMVESRGDVDGIDFPELEGFRSFSGRKLVNIAAKLNAVIQSALKGDQRRHPIGPVSIKRTVVCYGQGLTYHYVEGKPEDLLFWGAQTLILYYAHWIFKCRECGGLFVKVKRQIYCSPKCSHVRRSREYRKNHPGEVSDGRHKTYRNQVAKTQGAAVAKLVKRRGPWPKKPELREIGGSENR